MHRSVAIGQYGARDHSTPFSLPPLPFKTATPGFPPPWIRHPISSPFATPRERVEAQPSSCFVPGPPNHPLLITGASINYNPGPRAIFDTLTYRRSRCRPGLDSSCATVHRQPSHPPNPRLRSVRKIMTLVSRLLDPLEKLRDHRLMCS